jgi:SAM-dependent MidA family methyltransferase
MNKGMLTAIVALSVYRTHNRLNQKLGHRFVDNELLDAVTAELVEELKHHWEDATILKD